MLFEGRIAKRTADELVCTTHQLRLAHELRVAVDSRFNLGQSFINVNQIVVGLLLVSTMAKSVICLEHEGQVLGARLDVDGDLGLLVGGEVF